MVAIVTSHNLLNAANRRGPWEEPLCDVTGATTERLCHWLEESAQEKFCLRDLYRPCSSHSVWIERRISILCSLIQHNYVLFIVFICSDH